MLFTEVHGNETATVDDLFGYEFLSGKHSGLGGEDYYFFRRLRSNTPITLQSVIPHFAAEIFPIISDDVSVGSAMRKPHYTITVKCISKIIK